MFEVDLKGLSKLIEDQGASRLIGELVRNSFDERGVTEVIINVKPVDNRPLVSVAVEDDAPEGFADLSHAWTLFAPSHKLSKAETAGRFNLGDKLFIASSVLANDECRILSTTGGVEFSLKGGRKRILAKRENGSLVSGYLKATRKEYESEIIPFLESLLIPESVKVTLNGKALPSREHLLSFRASLPTVLGDDEGVLRRTTRETTIKVYDPLPGESPALYELGIPVVETGDKYLIDVGQKIPLNFNRDNVTPSYLRTIRTLVANETAHLIRQEDANKTWVNEALSDERSSPALVHTVLKERFGDKIVVHNPADPEASANAFASGYTVVHGSQLSKEAWEQVRAKAPIQAASNLFPTGKAFAGGPGAKVAEFLAEDELTPGMKRVIKFAKFLHNEFFFEPVSVKIYKPSPTNEMGWSACYSKGELVFHLKRLGHSFFDTFNSFNKGQVFRLIAHEFGHWYESNHLSDEYHEGLCEIADKYGELCLHYPEQVKEAAS